MSGDSGAKQLAREIRKLQDAKEPTKTDWWARAGVISSFFSSVVIGTVGLYISSSFQKVQLAETDATAKAQIEIAKIKNEEDRKLQESRFAADLLQQLLSDEPRHRALAIVMLHRTVEEPMYEEIVAMLADRDPDPRVRTAAIKQLGQSKSTQVAVTLSNLAQDTTKPQGERSLAADASTSVAFSELATGNLLFMAASPGQASYESNKFEGGVFTHYLLEAIAAKAGTPELTPNYLRDYIGRMVPATARELGFQQNPYTIFEGSGTDKPLLMADTKTYALVIGISQYSDRNLRALQGSHSDAERMEKLLVDKGAQVSVLTDSAATCASIQNDLRQITAAANKTPSRQQSDIILYFSGHGWSERGIGYLACVDTDVQNPSTTAIPIETVSRILGIANSSRRMLFLDASSADPFQTR
jgi:hypothetical protein